MTSVRLLMRAGSCCDWDRPAPLASCGLLRRPMGAAGEPKAAAPRPLADFGLRARTPLFIVASFHGQVWVFPIVSNPE